MIKQALILASGLGTRMRPITDHIPKPMVEIQGFSMISAAITKLYSVGIRKIIITCFYKADVLQDHVNEYTKKFKLDCNIHFVIEEELHEVWGSIRKSLSYLDNEDFLLVNGDSYWIDSKTNLFINMINNWRSGMNALLLLYPIERALGYEGKGDFDLVDGRVINPTQSEKHPFVYIGMQIISPKFLRDIPLEKTSIFKIYERLNYANIHGIIYDGYWFHVGTPESITETENFIREHKLLTCGDCL